jgi:hypothetical protein
MYLTGRRVLHFPLTNQPTKQTNKETKKERNKQTTTITTTTEAIAALA